MNIAGGAGVALRFGFFIFLNYDWLVHSMDREVGGRVYGYGYE